MLAHIIGASLTLVLTMILGPLGLILGIVAWVLMAKN